MKLHRMILLGIMGIIVILTACTPNEPVPATALRGAIVPTRVTETPLPTIELTELVVITPVSSTNTPAPDPTDAPPVPTEEATVAVTTVVTDEPTATEESLPTEESTIAVIAVVTDEPTVTEEATEVLATVPTDTATLRPSASHTPTTTPTDTPPPTPTLDIPTSQPIVDVEIAYGDVVTGTINNETYEARYIFEAEAGDIVSIIMRSTNRQQNLDGYLTLLAPNGAQLTVNDDLNSLQSYDPGIANYEISQSGAYTIIASRFNGVAGTSSGDFELTLSIVDITNLTPTATATASVVTTETTIAYGERVQGEISAEAYYVAYQFVAEQGDTIGISMNALSGTLDPQVILFSANGAEIASNDDDPLGGFNAYLRDFVIPADGVYTIWATRFNRETGTSSGEYELRLEKAGTGTTATPVVTNNGDIFVGDTITGEISNSNYSRIYTFAGTEGQVVTVTMRADIGNLDPYLILIDPNGEPISRNDDGVGMGFNSSLNNVTLPTTGNYKIVATRFQPVTGVTAGTFQLALTEGSGVSESLFSVKPIGLGDSVSDELIGRDYHYYTFLAEAGDVVTITHTTVSGNLNPLLAIEDAYGTEFTRSFDDLFDPDENYNNAAIRDFIIPTAGYYTIVAGYSGETVGQYRLTLNRVRSTTVIPQYATLDWGKSRTFVDGLESNYLISAGDWLVEGVERRLTSVMTFRLPPLDGRTLQDAQLTLGVCYLTNSNVFGLFGDLAVSSLGYYASDVIPPLAEETNVTPLETLVRCQNVALTDLVTEAYDAQATYLQIQVNFMSDTINTNNAIDAVIFVDPRLELYFETP